MQRERRVEIQWLRALAACEVVVCHSFLLTKHISTNAALPAWYQPFSAMGVELFFIVSGYVICMRIGTSESGWSFLRSRILRLYPMYWLFTSLAVLAYALNSAWRLNNFTPDLVTLAKSYLILPQMGFPILGVGWTLEHEMIFYSSVAAMLLTLGGGTRARLGLAWLMAAFGATGIVFAGVPSPVIAGAPGAGSSAIVSHVFSPFMFAFGLGWLIRSLEGLRPVERALSALPFAAFALAAFWLAPEWGLHPIYRIGVAAMLFIGFIACRGLFADNALNRLVWKLGDASFSIYLSHWFVLSAGGKLLGHFDVPASLVLPARIIGIVLSIAVGVAVFLLVEKPLDRRLRRMSSGEPAGKPLPPDAVAGGPALSALPPA
ncbi:acyltransferase family protein [Bosea caraganae]|uniref:acyltransferase family protein n=1 Tax=Bosea caraganae TaxID=2763117 RepID=UPI001FE30974|nr:acyltransferase [Bosea caraganae]